MLSHDLVGILVAHARERRHVLGAPDLRRGHRALVVDLAENGGGSPEMMSYLSSYLFARRTHLNDLWTRPHGAQHRIVDARQRRRTPVRE